MNRDFIKVAACSPALRVGDCDFNAGQMIEAAKDAHALGVKLLAFPELSLTGYTCGDLFFQHTLIEGAWQAVQRLMEETRGLDIILIFGMPAPLDGYLFNCGVVLDCSAQSERHCFSESRPELWMAGVVPKTHLTPAEKRWFSPMPMGWRTTGEQGLHMMPDRDCLFSVPGYGGLTFAVEICNDLWVPDPPSNRLCAKGANLIINLAASDEGPGKADTRRALISSHSMKNRCAYIYASSGPDESTTDTVFGGHRLIAECGDIIAEAPPFSSDILTVTDIDIGRLTYEGRKAARVPPSEGNDEPWSRFATHRMYLSPESAPAPLTRQFSTLPFIQESGVEAPGGWEHILNIQAHGLHKRLLHTGCKTAVLGISGGLDSTLALLVTRQAFRLAGLPQSGILAYTLPCFGTTQLTRTNAYRLCKALGIGLEEIDITAAVRQHFADIGQQADVLDAAYENAQARERTQVLMDIANRRGGLVIGTGDLSELALGWATYNGDHMSMYGVNGGVPKTLIRYLLEHVAAANEDSGLSGVLRDILATPVSPELLPARDGQITQRTEDLVGPYVLHDFFLFHALNRGAGPCKLFHMACHAFAGHYDSQTIHHWLTVFFRRFFSQQFKRSCLPDGPSVGLISLSPRGGLQMPSDAAWSLWQQELEGLL